MKRKRSDDDDDEGAATASHDAKAETLKPAPKLNNLADELVRSVLSYFHFYERSKLRLVCRQMRDSVDAMPSPQDSLLEIDLMSLTPEECRQQPWTITCVKQLSTVYLIIRIPRSASVDDSDNGVTYQLPSLPLLKKIRPARLRIDGEIRIRGANVNVQLLGSLADEVGETVADLSIDSLAPAPLGELQEALGKFEHLTKLRLSTLFPLVDTVSVVTSLRTLSSLKLMLRREMVPEYFSEDQQNLHQVGLHLAALSSLPKLRELDIRISATLKYEALDKSDEAVSSFMRGCASIPNLECLSSELMDDRGDGSRKAFAFMLRQLQGLRKLSMLYMPTAQLWRGVHDIGGHKNLRTLAIYYDIGWSLEHLKTMAAACNQCFPSLAELELHSHGLGRHSSSEVSRALAGLKSHESLSVLKCGWDRAGIDPNSDAFVQAANELGHRIEVVQIPHYSYD